MDRTDETTEAPKGRERVLLEGVVPRGPAGPPYVRVRVEGQTLVIVPEDGGAPLRFSWGGASMLCRHLNDLAASNDLIFTTSDRRLVRRPLLISR